MTFAEKLKIECAKRDTSANAIVQELGFSHSAFTYWKQKKTAPGEADVRKIANKLSLSYDDLMSGVDGIPEAEKIATADTNESIQEPVLTEQEREIITIYRSMPIRKQYEFLKAMFEISHEGDMI